MGFLDEFIRVSADNPCPKCGHSDWCALHKSGRKAICTRVQSGMPRGEAGHLHYLPPGDCRPVIAQSTAPPKLTPLEVEMALRKITHPRNRPLLECQAKGLGVPLEALLALSATYDSELAALVFPMFDAFRELTGARYRRADGRKWSLKGGREGLFLSSGYHPEEPTVIVEGPTDAAAVFAAGFEHIIGRPNCSGGTAFVRQLVTPRTPILMLSDPDDPGIDGAVRLARELAAPVSVLVGPSDPRAYVTQFRSASEARRGILEGIDNEDGDGWRTVFRNSFGSIYNFSTRFK